MPKRGKERLGLEPEPIHPTTSITVFCANGLHRSKLVAELLANSGYEHTVICGVKNIAQADADLMNHITQSAVIVVVNQDNAAQLAAYNYGELVRDKRVEVISISEADHSFLSFYYSQLVLGRSSLDRYSQISKNTERQLRDIGFMMAAGT